MNRIFLISIIFIFISCEKEELPITPHSAGEILTQQIEIGNEYAFQVFMI